MFEPKDLTVFYLARAAEGVKAFERFVKSYKALPNGQPHELAIIFKGFASSVELHKAKRAFEGVPHKTIKITDEPFDIGAYLHAASRVNSTNVCFINTHTEILAPNWLRHLRNAISKPGIGMAGATASFESLYDSVALTSKMAWVAAGGLIAPNQVLADYYSFTLEEQVKGWMEWPITMVKRRSDNSLFTYESIEKAWNDRWTMLASQSGPFYFLRDYPKFPNAHIRSNGFIINRKLLLEIYTDLPHTKEASYGFESGPKSLSAQVAGRGLSLAVVDRSGQVYLPGDWTKSKTFRLEDQSGLLMGDNQTRGFERFSERARETLKMMSWGSKECRSAVYPLGFKFNADARPTAGDGVTSRGHYVIDHGFYGVNLRPKRHDLEAVPF